MGSCEEFAARWLRQPIATADAVPRGDIERLVAAAKKEHGRFVENVHRAVQLLVLTGAISAEQSRSSSAYPADRSGGGYRRRERTCIVSCAM